MNSVATFSGGDWQANRIRAAATYAQAHVFAGALPTFHENDYGRGTVQGLLLFSNSVAEARYLRNLGNPNDVVQIFQSVSNYAGHYKSAAFPTCHTTVNDAGETLYEIVWLKPGTYFWHDIPKKDLGNPKLEDIRGMFTSVNDWARANNFGGAFPTFHQGGYGDNIVYGVNILYDGIPVFRDVYEGITRMMGQFTFDPNSLNRSNRLLLLGRHAFVYDRIIDCGNFLGTEKEAVLQAYRKAVHHEGFRPQNPRTVADAIRGGNRIRVNLDRFFSNGDELIAQTLIHEMMHIADFTHPPRRFPDEVYPTSPYDTPGDGGPYFSSPPLRAELCISDRRALTQDEFLTRFSCAEYNGVYSISAAN